MQHVRIHALLDDASRFVVALDVQEREREEEMLELFARAVTRYGVPQTLYLDNGSTYRGDHLALVCSRLGIALRHAQPYDPQARGKMERFWRTLREQCLDFISPTATLHDLQVRLYAWLDSTYQHAPHTGLLGATPLRAWHDPASVMRPVDHAALATALLTTTSHPVAYARRRLLVELDHGARRRAHVYVKDAAEATLPTEAYFGVLWRAYQEHGFDELGLALALGSER